MPAHAIRDGASGKSHIVEEIFQSSRNQEFHLAMLAFIKEQKKKGNYDGPDLSSSAHTSAIIDGASSRVLNP